MELVVVEVHLGKRWRASRGSFLLWTIGEEKREGEEKIIIIKGRKTNLLVGRGHSLLCLLATAVYSRGTAVAVAAAYLEQSYYTSSISR